MKRKKALMSVTKPNAWLSCLQVSQTRTKANKSIFAVAIFWRGVQVRSRMGPWLIIILTTVWLWKKGWWSTMTMRLCYHRSGGFWWHGMDAVITQSILRMTKELNWAFWGRWLLIRKQISTTSIYTWNKTTGMSRFSQKDTPLTHSLLKNPNPKGMVPMRY